jgi:hypothetical protein
MSIKRADDGNPLYIKSINRLPLNGNDRELIISGCKYIADTVDNLNEKYNTNSFKLRVIFHDDYNPTLVIKILRIPNAISVLDLEISVENNKAETVHVGYINAIKNQISGNTIISIAKEFGTMINAKQLTLEDDSFLQGICNINTINMKKLYILSTGISWYNSKGFLSETFDIEQRHNSQLLSLNIAEFLDFHCNKQEPRWAIPCNDKLNKFFEFFESYNKQYPFLKENGLVLTKSMTVQEVFTRIKEYILRDIPTRKSLHKMVCEHLDWLFKTVAVTSTERTLTVNPHNILYNGFLIYKLIDTPPLPQQSILRISSAKRPTTRKTTSLRKRSIKSSSRKRVTIG